MEQGKGQGANERVSLFFLYRLLLFFSLGADSEMNRSTIGAFTEFYKGTGKTGYWLDISE